MPSPDVPIHLSPWHTHTQSTRHRKSKLDVLLKQLGQLAPLVVLFLRGRGENYLLLADHCVVHRLVRDRGTERLCGIDTLRGMLWR